MAPGNILDHLSRRAQGLLEGKEEQGSTDPKAELGCGRLSPPGVCE